MAPLPVAPTVISPVPYCQNAPAVALTATGSNLIWYNFPTGGVGSTVAPIPITTTAGNANYYVASVGCAEGPRANIVVTTTATPAAPTGLAVTAITFNSATLNWTGAAGSFYTVEYKLANTTTWTQAATGLQATTINLTNLILGGSYEWRVSANCAATGVGNTSAVQTFGTLNRNTTITYFKDGFGIKISPNPVNESATIDYLVPDTGEVTVGIYNENGKPVYLYSDGVRTAGQYQKDVSKQFKILGSATYFVRLFQNGKSISTKFVRL